MSALSAHAHVLGAERVVPTSLGRVVVPARGDREHATPLECPRCGARWQYSVQPQLVAFGDVELDLAARTVRRRGEWIALPPRVLDLLIALVQRAPRVVTRGELLRDVWGYEPDTLTRTVDTHVRILRRAIEPDPSEPSFVRTVVKVGYRFTI